jgi:gamma-glutamyltranspeptidase/glutathione hydrolase/leukotriene-C4 hydrolase
LIEAHRGAVVADDGCCSKIGRDVLREGGHAVDATVSTVVMKKFFYVMFSRVYVN